MTNNTNSEKRISLMIPTKDRPENIDRLLGSLENHKYLQREDFQAVVVDSSKDSQTKSVAHSFSAQHIDAVDLGKSEAMNLAIDSLDTPFIGFLDDDIIIISDTWLDTMMRNFNAPEIGYVSGRVRAATPTTQAQEKWEQKGALNKGPKRIVAGSEFFKAKRLKGVPVQLFTMGANHIMRASVLEHIGGHDERFGPGQVIPGAGADLDLSYKVIQHGYTAVYDPEAVVEHVHPEEFEELREKMFQYGISDTAIHLKFFAEYGDI
jgi:glycosyltransferase involved in cell wall biosynthesis